MPLRPSVSPAAPRRSGRSKRKTEVMNLTAPPLRPNKKQKTAATKRKTVVATAGPSIPTYEPSKGTLFLDNYFESIYWYPVPPKYKAHTDLAKLLASHSNNVHPYFGSKRAATLAADDTGLAHVYRHIGSVLLEQFSPTEEHIAFEENRTTQHVNLAYILPKSECNNLRVLDALFSLSLKGQKPYASPYIVVLADRKQFCAINPDSGADLTVEIYVGRLLFELIAYEDTKVLFSALRTSVPFSPLPAMPNYPEAFGKSPAPTQDDRFTTSGLLRRAESTGYASLRPEHRQIVKDQLTVDLYPFQQQTIRWMLDKENDHCSINQHFWEERSFTDSVKGNGGHYYYFPIAGELRLHKPPETRGGMVTEEMGLGKTVEALALIAVQKKEHAVVELNIHCEQKPPFVSIVDGEVRVMKMNQRNQDKSESVSCPLNFGDEVLDYDADEPYPKTLRVRRWPAKTTLVLCPKSLLEQWKREAEKRAPSLSLVVWERPVFGTNLGTSPDVAVGEHAKDIVLATYDALKNDKSLFKITWKRLILDEAQVTRQSSAQVAKDTFNLRSESRFLMTGTPIVKDVEDLRGELAFLRVWPFTLFEDGFWESQIYSPFSMNRSTVLLDHLLSVTMMRHTKAQHLSINLPPRSYETIEVELSRSHRAVYCFILGCCLEELDEWRGSQSTCPRSLRALLRLLLSACISPELLNLAALDLARRSTWSRRSTQPGSSMHRNGVLSLVKTTAVEAIRFLAETGTRIARDSNRALALQSKQQAEYETYLKMDVDDLVTILEAKDLMSAVRGTPYKERLAQLAAGGVHRLESDTLAQLRQTTTEVGLTSTQEARKLSRDRAVALLTVHFEATQGKKHDSIHEAGFVALTKLIEKKESPSCPVCLTASMDRISLTKCGHFYCVDCINLMFDSSFGPGVKCAMCRRQILPKDAIEVVRQDENEESATGPVQEEECEEDVENPASVKQAVTFISESDVRRYRDAPRPTTNEVWNEYRQIRGPSFRFRSIGRNSDMPSLDADFLRHMEAATAGNAVAPKLFALRKLIRSCDPDTKFCVVAETTDSLKGIALWLGSQGIVCVGVGSPGWYGAHAQSLGKAAEDFSNDPTIKVFLLNTANAAGLTLTAANCVVFMESMVRITDEMQAAARVHRIGQARPVRIVRIVARNTIEEQIMFRRGEIHNAGQETNALVSPNGELPARDIVRLFRDVGRS